MQHRGLAIVVIVTFCVLFTCSAWAQSSLTGFPPFSTQVGGQWDTVNLADLNVHIAPRITARPGRGLNFRFDLSYDSTVYQLLGTTWFLNFGWTGIGGGSANSFAIQGATTGSLFQQSFQFITCRGGGSGTATTYSTYEDPSQTFHPFVTNITTNSCNDGSGGGTTTTNDGSGFVVTVSSTGNVTTTGPDGTIRAFPISGVPTPSLPATVTDRNGNQITFDGTTLTDTLGTSPLSLSGSYPGNLTYQFPTPQGGNSTITVSFVNPAPAIQSAFGCTGILEESIPAGEEPLIDTITLQDGSTYKFTYEPTPGNPSAVTGRLGSVKLPTGATISYTYPGSNDGINCSDGTNLHLTRTTPDGTWTYDRTISGAGGTTTVTDPLGNQTIINFQSGVETERQIYQGSSNGTLLQTIFTCYNGSRPNCSNTTITPPITEVSRFVLFPNGKESETDAFFSSSSAAVTEIDEYDFGANNPGSLLRKIVTNYASLGNNILDLAASVTVCSSGGTDLACNGSGTKIAQTTYGYDETTPTATSGVPQHVSVSGARGNQTSVHRFVNTTNSNLTTSFSYDDTGNKIASTDPNGNQTQFSYSDNFSDGINRNSLAYLTQTTLPRTATAHITKTQYDFNTGLPTTTTDENNNQITNTYDSLLRPLTINYPDGGQASYTYNSPTSTSQSEKISSSQNLTSTTILDGLGRTSQQQLTSDPAGTVYTDTTYNAIGLVASISNPHRTGSNPTDGTTQFTYDALGRMTLQTQPDGSTIQTTYSGNCVTTTNEAGQQRKSCSDGLGHSTSVFEDPSSLNYETDYTYDALNNLLTVNQKGGSTDSTQWRTRTITYDSLSRVIQSSTPEQGTLSLAYLTSAGGNCSGDPTAVCRRTDARNITTTYTYDALNRVTQKSYSDGTTPTANFVYDTASGWGNPSATQSNIIGRLSEIYETGTTIPGNQIFGYDSMGRINVNNQCTPSICGTGNYPVSATYNLIGGLTSVTYPSGRLVSFGYNLANSLNSIQFTTWNGTAPSGGAYTYWSAADANFYPNGLANVATLGNGITQTHTANDRLQLTRITIANSQISTFADHTLTFQPTGVSNPANNGSVYNVADQLSSSLTQNFTYDHLNRLSTANEGRWGLGFVYDPWGNFLQQNLTSGSAGTRTDVADSHNRFAGKTYDAAGNTLNDTFHQYVYDAENHITSVDNGADTYIYAGNGTRVRKLVGSTSTEYIYFSGQLLAVRASDGTWQDYVSIPEGMIARAQDYDRGLDIFGTRCSSCGSQFMLYYLSNAGGLNNYTIRSGDKLYFTQYQVTGSRGGAVISFSDGTNSNWGVKDKEGYFLNDDQTQAANHFRTVDLSSLAGKTVTQFALNQESDTAPGSFAIIFEQMVLLSTDGTVHPIYTGQATSPVSSMSGTSGITGAGNHIDINSGHAIYPQLTTLYFGQDHLGSSRTITGGYGFPLWQSTFLPYGQEYIPQPTVDNFKFTGLEHDDETGLDHTWFRQYGSALGRWTAPDPYSASMDPGNPQSLNRYAYVKNNPLSSVDPTGLDDPGGGDDPCGFFDDCFPPGPGWGGLGIGFCCFTPTGFPSLSILPGEVGGLPGGIVLPGPIETILADLPWNNQCNPYNNPWGVPDRCGLVNGFADARAIPWVLGGIGEGICIIVEPCGIAQAIGIAVASVVVLSTTGDNKPPKKEEGAVECWNQFIRDMQACQSAYPKGSADVERCYKAAKAKFDLCRGKTGPVQ